MPSGSPPTWLGNSDPTEGDSGVSTAMTGRSTCTSTPSKSQILTALAGPREPVALTYTAITRPIFLGQDRLRLRSKLTVDVDVWVYEDSTGTMRISAQVITTRKWGQIRGQGEVFSTDGCLFDRQSPNSPRARLWRKWRKRAASCLES